MIVVTGGSGHLGQWVVAELSGRGHEVLCLARRPQGQPSIAGATWSPSVRSIQCDLATARGLDALRPELPRVRAVVHLAAHVPSETARNSDEDADATRVANALGTVRLLTLLGDAPLLQTVVYASTFEVYGPVQRLPVDELHPTQPTNYYGASKLAGEKYLQLFGSDRHVATASLRLPAIYGPGDRIRRAIGNFVRSAAEGNAIEIHGDGEDLRDLVYVADAARAVALSVERAASGVFNVASGRGFSIREMAEAVQRVAGSPVEIRRRERVKPRADYVLSIDRARAALGWSPSTTLDDGVRAQLAWVRALPPGSR